MKNFNSRTLGLAVVSSMVLAGCNAASIVDELDDAQQQQQQQQQQQSGPTYPTLVPGISGPSAISVLTLNSGTRAVGTTSGTFNNVNNQVTVAGTPYGATRGTNSYVAFVEGGTENSVVAVETLTSDMPNSGSANYNGGARVVYTDTAVGRTFTGTMDATVTAGFAPGGTVSVDLRSPNGTVQVGANPLVASDGIGEIDIDGLAISGSRYASAAGSTASVTNFTGFTDLNTAPTVNAAGVFAGPQAAETGGVATIRDAAGTASVTFTAKQ